MSLELRCRERLLATDDGKRAVHLLDTWEDRWRMLKHFYASNQTLLGCVCDDCERCRDELEK